MKLFERRQYSSSHLSRAHILTQPISLSLSLFRTRIIISIHNAFIALSQLLPFNTTKIALVCIALIRLTLYSHCNLNWKLYTNTQTRTHAHSRCVYVCMYVFVQTTIFALVLQVVFTHERVFTLLMRFWRPNLNRAITFISI